MSEAPAAPCLTDGIVLLRPPVEDDAPAIAAACQDPEVSRFTAVPNPYQLRHAVEWIATAPAAWRDGTSAPMVIVDAGTRELLGACGLIDVRDGEAEIGYWIKREERGRGIATRAVVLLTDWALGDLGLLSIELLADVRNVASQRVAEKAGYTSTGLVAAPARCADRCTTMVRFLRQNRSGDDRFGGPQ
jgi:RimJ/RimL family protein N-acetyltransferase